MRPIISVISILFLAACGAKTPPCDDATVTSTVQNYARQAISDALLARDPELNIDRIMSQISISLTGESETNYDRSIDKHICKASLRVAIPAEVAALNNYRAFQTLALGKTRVDVEGNEVVAPVTYTTYLSKDDNQLIVYTDGDDLPAKYIKGAYAVGAFHADLASLPDLRAGLTLYTTTAKSILIEPVENGALKFHINHQSHMCRSWTQFITEERGDTLIYANPKVGCTVYFSRLGQIMLVEHEGCELVAKACFPDGIYSKQ
ncbi:MAG: hypothetical protein PVH25_14400 [Burkholderiales bacterium]